MGVGFLWAKFYQDLCISHGLSSGDVGDLVMHHYKDGIGSFLPCLQIALHHAPKIFSKSCLPCFSCGGVMHQPFVTADCFSCGEVHHWHSHLFEVKACWHWCGSEFIWCEDVSGMAQMHSVRKFIASWLTMLLLHNPPSIGMNQTFVFACHFFAPGYVVNIMVGQRS